MTSTVGVYTSRGDSLEQYFARLREIFAVRVPSINSIPRQAIVNTCSVNSFIFEIRLQIPAQFIEKYFARLREVYGVSVADKVLICPSIPAQAIVDSGCTNTLIFENRLPAPTRIFVDTCAPTSFIPGARQAPTRAVADTRSVTSSLPEPVLQVLRNRRVDSCVLCSSTFRPQRT